MTGASGIRFDIYERVHVSDELAAIKELEEIELIPHIRLQVEGEQAVLKGNLWLTGTYVGERDEQGLTLEHLIPVEISLPINRISRMEEIAVDIENFDVELLSARSLNVTGVLSLKGVEVAVSNEWREEEEVVFVHQAEKEEQVLEQPEASADAAVRDPAVRAGEQAIPMKAAAVGSEQIRDLEEAPGEAAAQSRGREAHVEAAAPSGGRDGATAEAAAPSVGREQATAEAAAPSLGREQATVEAAAPAVGREGATVIAAAQSGDSEAALTTAAEQAREPEQSAAGDESVIAEAIPAAAVPQPLQAATEAGEEKKELKIAFAAKPAEPVSHLKSLIGREGAAEASAGQTAQASSDVSRADVLEWKKLFLSKEGEGQQFRKLRVCIVQKEETLETIASRYRINPREIVLHNRLGQPQVHEGQVIMIPS